MRRVRFLFGWMPRDEAINTFLGRVQAPAGNIADYAAQWEAAHQALQARGAFQLPAPVLREVPRELMDRANAFRARPDVISAFQALDWTVGIADLEHVLSFQKTVSEEHALDRVAGVEAEDMAGLFSVCLPDPVGPVNLDCAVDADGKGLTFFSSNRQEGERLPACLRRRYRPCSVSYSSIDAWAGVEDRRTQPIRSGTSSRCFAKWALCLRRFRGPHSC
jgi:hypothetical protein